jgi:hypothetical protein
MNTWEVVIDGVGSLGTVQEKSEELARCAALHHFAIEGERQPGDTARRIFESDAFYVRRA